MRLAKFGCATSFIVLVSFAMVACDEGSKSKGKNPTAQNAAAAGTGTNTGTGTADGAGPNTNGRAYYLGHDGKNDYSLLLSNGREYSIQDTSIATIKRETVNLAPTTIDEMVEEARKNEPELFKLPGAEDFLRQYLGCSRQAIKVTPLKPGKTYITGRRNENNNGDRWNQESQVQISLVVNHYTPEQFEAGKARYTNEGSGNLKACKSCHETGEENAPPHELGKISEIADAQAIEWVTTGKTGGRKARITHTWEFSAEAQKQGIVAYLRAKASKDLENFTRLVFEEEINNFRNRIKENGGRLPGPPPNRNGTGTGTGTGTQGGQFRCRGFGPGR